MDYMIDFSDFVVPESVSVIKALYDTGFTGFDEVTIPANIKIFSAYPEPRGVTQTEWKSFPARIPLLEEPSCVFESGCVIKGYKGTEAERYAKEWNITFIALDEQETPSNDKYIENGIKYQLYTDHAVAVGYTEEIDKNLIIADSVKNVPVTEIAKEAFAGCDSIETLKIPDSVTFVGAGAFRYCNNLKSIALSKNSMVNDGVGVEWQGILTHCPSVEKVTFSQSEINNENKKRFLLDEFLFFDLNISEYNNNELAFFAIVGEAHINVVPLALKKLIVTDGEVISKGEFDALISLEDVTLPDSIKKIESASFRNCENLKKVNIPKSINYIGDYAFGMCKNVEFGDIEFSDSIEYIGTRAFELCNGITSLHIPASIKKIGGNAFKSCENLKNFTLDGTPEIVSGLDKMSIKYAYGIIGNCPDIENVIVKSEKFTFIDNENNANDITMEKALFNCSVFEGTEDKYTSPEPSINIPKSAKIQVLDNVSEVPGDANCDGDLSMADAVIIMQSLANPDKYGENGTDKNHITEQGKKNADIAGDNDGITNADALAIQKKLLKLD